MRVLIVTLVAFLIVAIGGFGQTTGGAIKGVLTDDSGAVIPAAVVSLTGNGLEKSTQSQGDGTYAFNGLAPGQYTVRATVPPTTTSTSTSTTTTSSTTTSTTIGVPRAYHAPTTLRR